MWFAPQATTRGEALLERGGPRRVVATQRPADDADAGPVHVGARLQPVDGGTGPLHHHEGHHGSRFDERRAGLDHLAWGVPERADLDRWAHHLDELDVEHSGVIDKSARNYSAIVLRDPDGIQLELFHRHG